MTPSYEWPAIVIGGGNAALCAAITIREAGYEVLVLEAAPATARGGNSYFAGGGLRFAHNGRDDLVKRFPELDVGAEIRVPAYTSERYLRDMGRNTEWLTDHDACTMLVGESRAAVEWLHDHGVRLSWSLGRHAFDVGGVFTFPPGLCANVGGGGAGLVDTLYQAAVDAGVEVRYGTRMIGLHVDERGRVQGVTCRSTNRQQVTLRTQHVVLACGGFESNSAMRAQYLGTRWDVARVRGTPYNMGAGLEAAIEAGAAPHGNWSGCHAVASDVNTPAFGDRTVGDLFARHSYPFGIVVNTVGERFIDEGADFQPHTYAKYGAEILQQDRSLAFQIFDADGMEMIRTEYKHRRTTRDEATSITGLAEALNIDPDRLCYTVERYNAAIGQGEFNPNVLDAKRTHGLSPEKTNWARPIVKPPFVAFPVTTAITFTFGGIRVDNRARVLDVLGQPVEGLYAAGEMVGGLYYFNYASGTGLVAGSVFGRTAGGTIATQLSS